MTTNINFQHALSDFVNREVIYCVSSLFYELIQKSEHFPDEQEDLFELTASQDYEEPARDEGWQLRSTHECDGFFKSPDEPIYVMTVDGDEILLSAVIHPDEEGTLFWSGHREGLGEELFEKFEDDYDELHTFLCTIGALTKNDKVIAPYDLEETFECNDAESWEELCREQDIEPYEREVFEHHMVSSWLGGKLSKHGEVVKEVFNMTVWGRTTTGQSISMDGVIEEIYKEIWPEEFENGKFIGKS